MRISHARLTLLTLALLHPYRIAVAQRPLVTALPARSRGTLASLAGNVSLRGLAAIEGMSLVLLLIMLMLGGLIYLALRRRETQGNSTRGGRPIPPLPSAPVAKPTHRATSVGTSPAERPAPASSLSSSDRSDPAGSSSHPAYPQAPADYNSGEFRIPVPPPSSPSLDPQAAARAAARSQRASEAALSGTGPVTGSRPSGELGGHAVAADTASAPKAKPWYPEPPPAYGTDDSSAQAQPAAPEPASSHPAYPDSPPR